METGLARKTQDTFFWIATGVLAAVAFVYSGHRDATFPLETVPVTFPRETIFFTLVAAAVVFAALRRGGELTAEKRTAFLLLAGFMIWAILASLWAANIVGHARRLVELAFFCGWAFALSTLVVPFKKVLALTWVLGFAGGITGLAIAAGPWAFEMKQKAWPFGNPNAAGMFCAFAVLLNVGLLLETLRKHRLKDPDVILSAACMVFAFIGLMLTLSKGAILGLIIGAAVLAWQFFPRWRRLAVVCTVVVLAIATSAYLIRASAKEDLADTTSGFRVRAYVGSLAQIGGAPIGGRGLGSFYAYFPQYAYPALSGHKKMGDAVFHAHSHILEIGTELGIVGMLLFGAFTYYLGIPALLRKEPGTTQRDRFETIWVAAFLAISVHALVAVHFYWTETVLYFWTAAGVLLALGRKSPGTQRPDTTENKSHSDKTGKDILHALFSSVASNRMTVLPFAVVAALALSGLWYVGVYRELIGRTYVAMREKQLKRVRIEDGKYSDMNRRGMTRTQEYQKTQFLRFKLYSMIVAELNEELGLVHDPRMRTDTYYQLGSAYYNIGGVLLGPSAPDGVLYSLGKARKTKKQYRAALHFFKLVIKDAPGYVNTDYFLGRTYVALGEKNKAIESLEKYLAFNIRAKMSGDATLFLARTYRSGRKYPEAIKILSRYLRHNPQKKESGDAALLLARVYADSGQVPDAISAINGHLQANPESKKKQQLISYLTSLKNRLRKKTKPTPKPKKDK